METTQELRNRAGELESNFNAQEKNNRAELREQLKTVFVEGKK